MSIAARIITNLRGKAKRLLRDYINNLTIHGATKVLTGSIPEQIFWAILSFGVLGYFFYSAYGLLMQFMSYEFIVSTEVFDVEEVKLPAITVCDGLIFFCAAWLYKNESVYDYCKGYDFHKMTNDFKENIQCYDTNAAKWTKNCTYTTSSHPGCVTFNSQKTITQKVQGRHRKAQFAVSPTNGMGVYVFLHNTNEVPSWIDRIKYYVRSTGWYNVMAKKRDIKRLRAPFKSNCSLKENLSKGLFSYSKTLCHESCFARDMFRACGTLLDFYAKYLPSFETTNDQSRNNTTIESDRKCLKDFISSTRDRQPCKCVNLCQETVYQAEFKNTALDDNHTYLWNYFEDLQISKTTEIAAYDSTRFLADLGGLIGLLIGMSLLSLFEVIVCLGLHAFVKFCSLLLKFV